MTDTLDPRVERIFARALSAADEERETILREACGDDEALEREVRTLLAAHRDAGDFLLAPAMRSAPDPVEIAGRFRIVQKIGAGAMGTVYLAEQREPVQRTVALKIVRAGLCGPGTLRRFDTERQSVARMNHEGIARLFDSGTTEDGRPWFAMEHVAGESITAFCSARDLSLFARVWLVIAICRAVHHAHGKGVIHRDLKPGNVLVTEEDGRPVPKVIDFGVAKASASPLEPGAFQTLHGELVGTLEYMSPEQALGIEGGVDVRADVYGIGAILFELLTGEQPLPIRAARTQGLENVIHVLRDVEPPAPSARLAALADAAVEPTLRSRLRAEARRVAGDLDWIVLAAVEKDRARRYSSAAALADDLERFLRREPVSVAPPGRLYRLRKFERRHRAAVLSGAAVFASLVIGLAVALTQAHEAGRQRDVALTAAEDARRTLEDLTLFLGMVVHKTDEQLAELPGGTRARHDFASWALESLQRLEGRPELQDRIHLALGYATQRVGEAESALGRPKQALEWFARSLEHRELDAAARPSVATKRTLAVGLWKVGLGLAAIGDFVGAEHHHREALELLEELHAGGGLPPGEAESYLGIGLERLATALAALGREPEALELFERALATIDRGLTTWPDHPPLRQEKILALAGSSQVLLRAARAEESAARLDLALHELDVLAERPGTLSVWEPTHRARCLLARCELELVQGNLGAALADAESAAELARALCASDRESFESRVVLAEAQSASGYVLWLAQRAEAARDVLQEVIGRLEAATAASAQHVTARRAYALACGRLGLAVGGSSTAAGSAWQRRAEELFSELERAGQVTPTDRSRFVELRAAAHTAPTPDGSGSNAFSAQR